MHIKHRQSCRICGNPYLTEVIDLGEQYLQGTFEKGDLPVSHRKIPNKLVRCDVSKYENACGLVQTAHTVPPSVMYSNYWYQSSISKTMRDHLKSIANQGLEKWNNALSTFVTTGFKRKYKPGVLDIAANDLCLLKSYPEDSIAEAVGIDPCNITHDSHDEKIKILNDFYPSRFLKYQKFDIITSIAMFYDLEDPNAFVKQIHKNLRAEGIWCFEMAYLPFILDNLCFDTFCSEHLEHYHLAPIEYLLKKNDMQVVDAYLNDTNGGSIQIWATHEGCPLYDSAESQNRLLRLRLAEFDRELDTPRPYKLFASRVFDIKHRLSSMITGLKKEGKTIHLYGASTKCNTLIQYCDLDNTMIPYAWERSEVKWGAKTVGTNIEIISEEEGRKLKPDYVLVGPWHFKKEILEREADTINRLGIKFIFPLPDIEVIDHV